MNLHKTKSKSSVILYMSKSYRDNNGKSSSKNVERLGTVEELQKRLGPGVDVEKWAKEYIAQKTLEEKEANKEITIAYSPTRKSPRNQMVYNGGYLFLQKCYYELGLDKISKRISKKYSFKYDLNDILCKLLYSRIMYPKSKLAINEIAKSYIEQPKFDLHQIYRALEVLCKELEYIQSAVFKNSQKASPRNTSVVYYDCTNFFFETEEAEGLKQYGVSKEHRPNPIVQMGLFMDADGVPLSFCINPGNTSEQLTLRPLEEMMQERFGVSKLIVCTDAGLSSYDNRKFNDVGERAFITTQSLKTLKGHIKEWALSPEGWRLFGSKDKIDISALDPETDRDTVCYKERWINENGLEQRIIVTYSIKYRDYMRNLREEHINRAQALIARGPAAYERKRETDYKRYVAKTEATRDGEIATKKALSLDIDKIEEDARYDGFYGICTNVKGDVRQIVKTSKYRWAIEAFFRVMKTEFKSRPVYLKRDDRIKAHFLTCFLSLLIYKWLDKKIGSVISCRKLINTLLSVRFIDGQGEGYRPLVEAGDESGAENKVIGLLMDKLGIDIDKEIISKQNLRRIIGITKNARMRKK